MVTMVTCNFRLLFSRYTFKVSIGPKSIYGTWDTNFILLKIYGVKGYEK
jgi:hypothetical protein